MNYKNIFTWRQIQNRKTATPIDRLSMPDYLAFTAKPKFRMIKNILIAAGITLFFLLAVGLAGRADQSLMQAMQ